MPSQSEQPPPEKRLTKEEWIKRELAKRPTRSEAWKAETRRLWGFKPDPDDH